MADKKISALTAASTPLAGTEVLPIVQSGATVKVSVDNLTAGKTVPANAVIVGGGSLSSWGSNSPVEVGTNGTALAEQSSGSGLLTWNLYQNSGGNFVYKTSNPGLLHQLGSDGVYRWYTAPSGTAGNTASITLRASLGLTSGDYTLSTGNLIQGTAAKGVTTSGSFALGLGTNGSTSQVTINSDSSVSAITGSFNNVGAAQTITINDTNGGYVVITGVQGGVGSSTWTLPFVKRSGSLAIGTASKAILTADPISSVTVSSNNISVTPLAANTYITFAIYYTPLGA